LKTVTIPFLSRFERALKNGRKFMTSRTRKFGESGDHFIAFGQEFRIVSVYKMPLAEVADLYYGPEGFVSGNEFIECWNQIHSRKPFNRDVPQTVWVHQFTKVSTEQSQESKQR